MLEYLFLFLVAVVSIQTVLLAVKYRKIKRFDLVRYDIARIIIISLLAVLYYIAVGMVRSL